MSICGSDRVDGEDREVVGMAGKGGKTIVGNLEAEAQAWGRRLDERKSRLRWSAGRTRPPSFPICLRQGSSGEEVRWLRKMLASKGRTVTVDGIVANMLHRRRPPFN